MKTIKGVVTAKWMVVLCVGSFVIGMLFTTRMWPTDTMSSQRVAVASLNQDPLQLVAEIQCEPKPKSGVVVDGSSSKEVLDEVSKTHDAIKNLDKTMSSLEMELAAARAGQVSTYTDIAVMKPTSQSRERQKVFLVVGINTAFSSRRRRDSVRDTWMPAGEKLRKLEQDKGIVIRFVIGHSPTPGGILDVGIDAEDAEYGDFLRLDHVEGYNELSAKTKTYFSTAVAIWDADFYVKVDDDIHVNLGFLAITLARHRSKPRAYVGCMKSGPVLARKGVKYHEPEYWKFGEEGNRYFRHATGQIYAISRDLATYISVNQPILHKFANEDVSIGSWLIGLDIKHIDDRSFCCGTPPDCEWKAQGGNVCVASFDWACSGVCRSVDRMNFIHQRCSEGDSAVWTSTF